MHGAGQDQIDQVVERDQAAGVVLDGTQRQHPAPRHPAHEGGKIAFHPRPIDQRRANEHQLQPGLCSDLQQTLFGLPLALRIGAYWVRRVVVAKTLAMSRPLAMDLERTDENQAAHTLGGSLARQRERGIDVDFAQGLQARGRAAAAQFGLGGGMNDRVGASERRRPIGVGRQGGQRIDRQGGRVRQGRRRAQGHAHPVKGPSQWRRLGAGSQARRLQQRAQQRRAYKTAGTGEQNFRHESS